MDFYSIKVKKQTSNNRESDYTVYPDFKYARVQDLVCKGGVMYAFWDQTRWDTSMDDLIVSIDRDIRKKVKELQDNEPGKIVVGRYLNDNETKLMKQLVEYTKLRTQSEAQFNTKILFSDDEVTRDSYATNQLEYTPKEGITPAFDELLGLLYSDIELEKILWFAGALLTNSMANIQKFMFLYGGAGSGKGTVIKIFKMLFEGYHATIDLAHLTSGSEFATSQIQEVPLLIDDDSDISRITKDTNLLKLTAHEPISVNAKYRTTYDVTFNGLLITASNQRFQVRSVDAGITRRAVVVNPTTYTHDSTTYFNLMERLKYELPAVAQKCIDFFNEKGEHYYKDYRDIEMAEATDYIFSFVREAAVTLGEQVTLTKAAELFKVYLDDLGYETKGYKRRIKNELSRYYRNFYTSKRIDGETFKNVFVGFKRELVFPEEAQPAVKKEESSDVIFDGKVSTFDTIAASYPAQYANHYGTPSVPWDECKTVLSHLDTTKLHYVQLPQNHIVIDFDVKDSSGEKDKNANLNASKKFPPTYSELSKSGGGVHMHYIYDGDVSKLATLYDDDIEIKALTGKQALRRKLTEFNELPITHISSGLPQKEKKEGDYLYKDVEIISWNEKKMRTAIQGNIKKKYHDATKPSVDFIVHIFEEAEKEGIKYDLKDMRQDIMAFAGSSSNQASACLTAVAQINYCTIDQVTDTTILQTGTKVYPDEELYFYDIEVFPNLFVVVFKKYGDKECTIWINPTGEQIEWLTSKPLIGFNNRRYDNHILYARILGENLLSLYRQSQRIINDKDAGNGMYSGAYELSYADIYEYSSTKQSLKKWEIVLGIKHDELDLPWDQPVPEELWKRVGEYCVNDVEATIETFEATYQDYVARKIIAELSGLSINATTTQHAAKFLFGDDPRPQDKFIYTDLSEEFKGYSYGFKDKVVKHRDGTETKKRTVGSTYRGEDPSEGGYVYSEPGVYSDVVLLDVASEHPTSLVEMNYFGPYTQRYADLMNTRLMIKHGDFEGARKMFGGVLVPYLNDEKSADALSYALKIIINIVYGMTSAKFDNKFKHPKNVDNIVAKRGALFMIDLKHFVQDKGYLVAHIKTDSIKIPGSPPALIEEVFEFGRKYGYTFEHEATYSRMALVNKAVYICQYGWAEKEKKIGTWEATGTQFAVPYVFKTLFSGEAIFIDDYFVTKQATAPIYLGDKFIGKVANVYASKTGAEMSRVDGETRSAITGTKGYLWKLSSEFEGKEDIDMEYYDNQLYEAVTAIDSIGPVGVVIDELDKKYGKDVLPFEDILKGVEVIDISDDALPF